MGWSLKGTEKADTPPSPSYPVLIATKNPPLRTYICILVLLMLEC